MSGICQFIFLLYIHCFRSCRGLFGLTICWSGPHRKPKPSWSVPLFEAPAWHSRLTPDACLKWHLGWKNHWSYILQHSESLFLHQDQRNTSPLILNSPSLMYSPKQLTFISWLWNYFEKMICLNNRNSLLSNKCDQRAPVQQLLLCQTLSFLHRGARYNQLVRLNSVSMLKLEAGQNYRTEWRNNSLCGTITRARTKWQTTSVHKPAQQGIYNQRSIDFWTGVSSRNLGSDSKADESGAVVSQATACISIFAAKVFRVSYTTTCPSNCEFDSVRLWQDRISIAFGSWEHFYQSVHFVSLEHSHPNPK